MKYDSIGKAEFEAILHKVMLQVRRNTGIESDKISQTTKKVLDDMPNEYGQLNEADRTWEIKRSPILLLDDNGGEAFQTITKETYTPEQLAIIAHFTDAFGRARSELV